MNRDGATLSIWQDNIKNFDEDGIKVLSMTYDIAIVGGGITGITTALELQKLGFNCIVLEAQTLGFGSTSGTTAHLNTIIEISYDEIEKQFKKANELVHHKIYKEAIGKYLICLEINSLHIPSMFKVSNVFKMIDDHAQAKYYSDMAKDVLTRLWDEEMEREISQHYLPSN